MKPYHKPTVQGLWIGDRLSRFEYNSIKSYLKQGYHYTLYTYWPVANVPRDVWVRDAREIIPESEIFTFGGAITPFSDLFRYKLLYDQGGIWTDCDIICTRPFHLATLGQSEPYIFVTERTILKGAFNSCIKKPPYTCKLRKVLNSFIMAPKGSLLMKAMYERCLAELRKHPERYQPYVNPHNKIIKVLRRIQMHKTRKSMSGHVKSRSRHPVQIVEGQGSSIRRVEHRVVLWSGSSQAHQESIRKTKSTNTKSTNTKSTKSTKTKKALTAQKPDKVTKNIGLQSYHWPGGSKLLEQQIAVLGLDKWIRDPVFAFPVNWWDFRYIFQSVPDNVIPPSRGWTTDTRLDQILSDPHTSLVVIHNGWIKNQGLDKDAKYPPDSFFERLDRFVND
jgi:hypothetical protein